MKEKQKQKQKMSIRLTSYDSTIIDYASTRVIDAVKNCNCTCSGPIPLPTDREVITVIRSPHKYKDSREQFELNTHKRLIYVISPTQKVIDTLRKIDLPSGVNITIKV